MQRIDRKSVSVYFGWHYLKFYYNKKKHVAGFILEGKLFIFDLFPTEQVKYGWIAQNEFSFKKRKILITSNLSSYNVITIGNWGKYSQI